MAFRKISKDIKDRAMYLYMTGLVPFMVINVLGISVRSFWRWRHNLRVHGSVVVPRSYKQGRPRLLTATASADLYNLILDYPSIYLDEIQHWLIVAHDVAMARSTLHRNLVDLGLSYKKLRKAAAERDEEAREAFQQFARANWLANQLVFVDESSKDNRTIFRHFGRAVSGERAVSRELFNRGTRYSLVAAISTGGYLTMRAVKGSVNADEFFDFILEDVLPRMNPWPEENSVLIMDNCAIHKMEDLRVVVEAQGCKLFYLPAYSPDFNPIEESFSSLKYYLRRHWLEMQAAEDPCVALLEACGHITGDLAVGWYRHSGYIFEA